MMDSGNPWRDIDPPKAQDAINVRRADASHPLNYWLGKDFQGRYLFYLDANAEVPTADALPRLAGIELNALGVKGGLCRLVLTLLDSEQFDIFRALCRDLTRATADLARDEGSSGIALMLTRLRRWQGLLEKRRDSLLSVYKIIGLVGELLVLRDMILPRLSAADAVQSWRGPYGDEQDFLLAGKIIEVKTQLSTSDRYLDISSEHQLDTSSGPIMVCHQTLDSPSTEELGAFSLNSLIASLTKTVGMSDFAALDLFQVALLEAGYSTRDQYDKPLWQLNGRSFFEIREGFPRIDPPMVAPGIDRVRYRIALQACMEFEVSREAAAEWAFDDSK